MVASLAESALLRQLKIEPSKRSNHFNFLLYQFASFGLFSARMSDSKRYSGKRQILWDQIDGTQSILAFILATALGAGLGPRAPGTFGTMMGVPLAYLVRNESDWVKLGIWVGMTLVGIWAATLFDQMMKTHDNQNIVIDEVVGMGISSWTAGGDWKTWVSAFLLFRLFDVWKPFPVGQVDAWSKRQTHPLWDGIGVMMDDVIAGFQALLVIVLLQKYQILN